MIIILSILVYFLCLLALSWLTSRKADNRDFFSARHSSPWPMVAFGMIGASISGVTFVSVPGMVLSVQMTYLQMCMGYILGYFAVAFVLMPVYYKLRLTSIYSYLQCRLGERSYLSGTLFFLIGKMTGSAVKFYVVCMILQRFVLDACHVPFVLTVSTLVLLIWLYTRRGGIRTLVWTDSFQTLCILATLVLIILSVTHTLGLTLPEAVSAVAHDSRSRIFVFDDWRSTQNFWKQFLSGVFIVVVMTGLDQDMMQKNLTCRTLREAQKDLCSYGFAFLPTNLLLLALGVLLALLSQKLGMALPTDTDELVLNFTAGGRLGPLVTVLFSIGIVAACFSSADSALTALTTSVCLDLFRRPNAERLRKTTHAVIAVIFVVFILIFARFNSTSLLQAVLMLVGYTYGPLLGLFAYGLLTRRAVRDKWVPVICLASPLLCLAADLYARQHLNYQFGYELLMLNGALTFGGLWLSGLRR
ncbi:sodium:solute symporter [Hallella absiana]|uniref:sodium:solute symporter n=1 Tax=Hallella absiana TaxID=2925336 RepID=UPI0021C5AC03|nr:sodium:solute symporter [Hallella absiana]